MHYVWARRAPEQADADFGIRGPHSDVWSYGATLLHLATGRIPYADLSQMQMLSAMSKRRPPGVPASLPAWMRHMLQQCFRFDTAARPSVADLHKVDTCLALTVFGSQFSLLASCWHCLLCIPGLTITMHTHSVLPNNYCQMHVYQSPNAMLLKIHCSQLGLSNGIFCTDTSRTAESSERAGPCKKGSAGSQSATSACSQDRQHSQGVAAPCFCRHRSLGSTSLGRPCCWPFTGTASS